MVEPLLLLPGLGCDARLFLPAIARFSRQRAVQVAALQGAETVEALARATLEAAPARFALLGHGLGGAVALEVLRLAPERVHRVALVATDPLAETPPAAAARELRILGARSGRLDDAVAEECPGSALAPSANRGEIRALLRDMARALGGACFAAQSRAMQRRPDQQKTLRRMPHPALILGGAHDTIVPPRRLAFAAELMRNARLATIETAGHLPPLEDPGAFARALDAWLERPSALG